MGTALVGFVMAAIVAAIIFSLVKNKKRGKSSCGGDCAHCGAACHAASSLHNSSLKETILEIDGMMCPMCESHINDAIRNNFNVKSVRSSHKTGVCRIQSQETLDQEKLKAVIKETGYELKEIH